LSGIQNKMTLQWRTSWLFITDCRR